MTLVYVHHSNGLFHCFLSVGIYFPSANDDWSIDIRNGSIERTKLRYPELSNEKDMAIKIARIAMKAYEEEFGNREGSVNIEVADEEIPFEGYENA